MSRVNELIKEIEVLHNAKNSDYADSNLDPFRNFRMSERIGVPAHIGCFVRMGDKFTRIENLINKMRESRKVVVENESLKDTARDLAVYALIFIALLEEYEYKQEHS